MTPRVTIVHTSFAVVGGLTDLFAELAPDVALQHIVDDTLLPEVLDAGEVTESVRRRLLAYFRAAAETGAHAILSQCSSVGDVAEQAASDTRVPVVRIDAAMARQVCAMGRRVGVLATLETTLAPTARLIERTAMAAGRDVEIESVVVPDAFALRASGDHAAHDARVLAATRELASSVDAVALAQGTMASIVPQLGGLAGRVLSSPRLGVADVVRVARAGAGNASATIG